MAAGLCLWGRAWSVDEPFFLALARQIARDPLHPLSFPFNWYGWSQPMAAINNTPPVLPYLLAGALRLTGGGEFWTRALFFPFDLAAAWSLLALAARFLKKPLWPTLAVLAGPAWILSMTTVMAERVMAGFALSSLWLAVAAADEGGVGAWAVSAVLAALALASKYNALFVLPPALWYGRTRGVPPRRLAAWLLIALSGLAFSAAWSRAAGASSAAAAWRTTLVSSLMAWGAPSHRLRSLLAFAGGLGLPAALGAARLKTPSRTVLLAAVAALVALYSPAFDLAPVRALDRLLGVAFAFVALLAAHAAARAPRTRGAALWLSWLGAVAGLQLVYWSVVARFVVFLLPPLIFGVWERLENEAPASAERLGRAAFGAALALGLGLGAVERTYDAAQKAAAERALALARESGGTLWYWEHWGLQEYLSAGGARQLDQDRGGWEQARPGDWVLDCDGNSNRLRPGRPRLADATRVTVSSPVPLRHVGGWRAETGFYSSGMGFLPWTLSTEPLETFTFVRLR